MPVDVFRRRTQDLVSTLNAHRILVYSLVSTVAVSAAVVNALKQQSNFYSLTIQLSKSNRSVLILVNFGFLVALLCAHIAQQIFFGPLRAPEIERLYDRLWFFVTESLLAFTIFRDDFDILFALMFGFLLFIKSFHWLASDRIEWMDQRPYPGPPLLFHVRMSALFVLLWATDCLMFLIAAEHTLTNGVGGMVLFASEYAILMATSLNSIAKYMLSLYDIRRASQRGGENAPPWENKSMWSFYIELTTDFLKLTTYLVFFAVIITFYGLPLNIIRDVYITARSFIGRLRALHRYQTATRNMDQRYPNATAEELSAMSDRTCIICREEMMAVPNPEAQQAHQAQPPIPGPDGPNTTPKKLPCGHIFHFNCLRSWLERQQNCPTCRRTVLETHPQGQQAPPAGAPAPAQPGGFLQQPVPFGIPGMQAGQQPLNNPAGFLGRMLGFANQPIIVPGQFPEFPGANANNMRNYFPVPVIPAQLPQGIVVQYHIQLQVPRQPQQQQSQSQSHPQAPVPRFGGFQGPNLVWQPWGMDNRWFLHNNAVQPPDAPLASTSTTPSSSSGITPTPSANTTGTPIQEPQTRSSPSRNTSATRDFTDGPCEKTAIESQTAVPRTQGGAPGVNIENRAGTSVPEPPNSNEAHPHPRLNIPRLIPLYDYRAAPTNQPSQSSPYYSNTWQRAFSTSGQNAHHAHPQAPSMQTQSGHQQTQPRPATPQAPITDNRQSRHPISQLPPILTDDQLAVMDNLTREAIDERLRVLEGVSAAIFRCTDELLRMRSVLPRSLAVPRSQVPPTNLEDRETPATSNIGQMTSAAEDLQASTSEGVNPSKTKSLESSSSEDSKVENGIVDDKPTQPPKGDSHDEEHVSV